MSSIDNVYLSAIDEERFGIRTARATGVTRQLLPAVLDFCEANTVILLIARCPVLELEAAQLMERHGFILMDTLVYYSCSLVRKPVPPDVGRVPIRPIRPGEEAAVKAVAAEAFRGYFGHYHADDRLDRTKCDEAYVSWAFRSCISDDVADGVVVADSDGSLVGFATLRVNSAEEGEGVLFGVPPSAQGQGIFRSLVIGAMQWCLKRGAERMIYSTQIANTAVQKVLVRLGFEPLRAYYTFHKWFDRA